MARILVVEGDDLMGEMLIRFLRRAGFEVLGAR